jgi:hypothetical protein
MSAPPLLQGIGGTVLLLGAYFTYRQLQTARDQLQIAQEGQITERFSRAIEQLGSDKEDVQLGGIYTLERIANDSPKDRRTTQAVLGAYVRNHARWLVGSPEVPQHPPPTVDMQLPWLQQRAPAVNTAVVVLGRRPESQDELQLILSRVDLRGAYLPGARLSNTLLRHSNLARAQLPQAQLEGADLEDADLGQAKLPHTHTLPEPTFARPIFRIPNCKVPTCGVQTCAAPTSMEHTSTVPSSRMLRPTRKPSGRKALIRAESVLY